MKWDLGSWLRQEGGGGELKVECTCILLSDRHFCHMVYTVYWIVDDDSLHTCLVSLVLHSVNCTSIQQCTVTCKGGEWSNQKFGSHQVSAEL